MRGRLIRLRWETEELVDMISKKYGIPERAKARVRNYLILLGIYQFLKMSDVGIIKPDMSWEEIRKLEEKIREELSGAGSREEVSRGV